VSWVKHPGMTTAWLRFCCISALFFGLIPSVCVGQPAHGQKTNIPLQAQLPSQIVSLTPCLDSLLLTLAKPSQIAALSAQAHDPEAASMAREAKRFPITAADAEAVLEFTPDLVLASRHTPQATRNALTRAGVRLVLFGVPNTLPEAYAEIDQAGQAIGGQARARAQRLIAAIQESVAKAKAAQATKLGKAGKPQRSVLIYQQGGLVAGAGTLPDALLKSIGLSNAAAQYGVHGWGLLPLEEIVARPPALLLTPSQNGVARPNRLLAHPALRALAHQTQQVHFPALYIYCGGPVLQNALASLEALP
jgi:iron complex transport system substrate-binding protein